MRELPRGLERRFLGMGGVSVARRAGKARTFVVLGVAGAVIAACGLVAGAAVYIGSENRGSNTGEYTGADVLISEVSFALPEYRVPLLPRDQHLQQHMQQQSQQQSQQQLEQPAQQHPSMNPRGVVRPHLGIPDAMGLNAEVPVGPNTSPPEILPTDGPIIQLCLILDTSNSMDGLINQAKARLWNVVNELGRASQCDPCPRCGPIRPQLQVAVYEYGNNSIEAADGYVRLRIPFTTDLDLVSEQLFSLTTNGGQEFCGWAIRDAVSELAWMPVSCDHADSPGKPGHRTSGNGAANTDDELAQRVHIHTVVCPIDDDVVDAAPVDDAEVSRHAQPVMRVLVIAGNEPFTQGRVHYAESISEAVAAGVTVHTVFCGPKREGETTGWADGARAGNGKYMWIDQNTSFQDLATPFDARLTELNTALNATYLPYGGRAGEVAFERQEAQDRSNRIAGSMSSRAAVKSSAMYSNAHWDLIDALESKTITLESIKNEDLPEALRGKTIDERRSIVAQYQRDRERVRGQMLGISRQRAEYLMSQRRGGPADGVRLDDAIVQAIREQAEESGLRFVDQDGEGTKPIE